MDDVGEPQRPVWAGECYAAEARHHRSFDDWFLDQQRPGPRDLVVDAGCGSGEFTARLARLLPGGEVLGVEPDPSMLAAARRHEGANLTFVEGRLQDLDVVCGRSSADLVVSRAVLHWIPLDEYRSSFEAVRRTLRPGGWFHAESAGAGNVRGLRSLLDEIAGQLGIEPAIVTLPEADTAFELLELAGFEIPPAGVSTVAQRRAFDRAELLGFVRTQASVAYGLGPSHALLAGFVAAVERRVEELRRHDGSYDQTFVRLHLRCRRPS